MRKSMVEAAAWVGLFLSAGLAAAQPPTPAQPVQPQPQPSSPKEAPSKSKLEEMLEKALRDNPDVRLAAAKVTEAEAELSKARLTVVQKVAATYQAVEAQKAAVAAAGAELDEVRKNPAYVPEAILSAAQQKLIDAKAKLAGLEADLSYLLGRQPEGADPNLGVYLPAAELQRYSRIYPLRDLLKVEQTSVPFPPDSVQGPTADRIRAALDKPFTYDSKDTSIDSLIKALNQSFSGGGSGLIIKNNWTPAPNGWVGDVVKFDQMPMGAVLEWVEDDLPGSRAVVRDYGVVIVRKDDIPPGAPLLRDFWKGAKAQEKRAATETSKTSVEGRVKGIMVPSDGQPGTYQVTLGLDKGLVGGDILNVYHPEDKDGSVLMVGRLRVERVGQGESTAVAYEGASKTPIQVGDKVRVAPKEKPVAKPDAKDESSKERPN